MEQLGLNQLRSMFQEFYKSKGHYAKKSFSLVPEKDKSLLIINSGMAPLKPYFAGLETPPSKRMTTCQKCIRTGDIENVGYTARHGTFFEMLGSFSFGDYFKEESITWGWEFITEVLKMPVEKIWASVYEEDNEAVEIWKNKIGLPEERIVPLGKDDNFWEIGIGPCGPCSEIYFDRGEKYGCDNPDCKPGCECDRYVEFWNHVFTQFNKDENGNYTPLAHPNIDTGMGLERLACIMQNVDSIFDVDTIKYILDEVVNLCKVKYERGKAKTDISIRIITDHIRSVTFMIADGIMPSNEGRGYVLRRLLRRAARHGKLLGIEGSFLAELSKKVIEISGLAYPELEEKKDYIYKILSIEEEKFSSTIDQGTIILNDFVEELKLNKSNILSGEQAFKLYDTYGFPVELTQEILEENHCSVDMDGFNEHMAKQKELARSARKSDTDAGWSDEFLDLDEDSKTQFIGYNNLQSQSTVKSIFVDKQSRDKIIEGDSAIVILDKTPFYAESGGQASDTGVIYNDNCRLGVSSVSKLKGLFLHKVKVISGELNIGNEVTGAVDKINRNNTARNHTATHILHKALRQVLGKHIEQAGSNVTSDSLRFDFSHFEAISKENLEKVETIVNEKISEFLPVKVEEMKIADALNKGVTALFGEKYGDIVRVVSVGEYSLELCGGTHVDNSGQIGAFKIISENGVAAGVRRIEAVTAMGLYKKSNENEQIIQSAGDSLKTNTAGILTKINNLIDEAKAYKKELEEFKKKSMTNSLDKIYEEALEINGVKLITKKFNDYSINDLRNLSDDIKNNNKGIIIVFATVNDGKVTFMASITDDLLEKGYHAGNMIKKIAAAAGGGGGGKADMAQAGGKDPSKIDDAFNVAKSLL
ncbi:alanine--tRNA ligase [Anaerovorax odorimutans]|uniref:alanine--tRNA ligase n=1 Tax=Anaerovorax odorimutans TaxID=109327 RepID=UPI0003FB8025|nr:alanine--tRNA ligase [Anaerovorax odorimutans]